MNASTAGESDCAVSRSMTTELLPSNDLGSPSELIASPMKRSRSRTVSSSDSRSPKEATTRRKTMPRWSGRGSLRRPAGAVPHAPRRLRRTALPNASQDDGMQEATIAGSAQAISPFSPATTALKSSTGPRPRRITSRKPTSTACRQLNIVTNDAPAASSSLTSECGAGRSRHETGILPAHHAFEGRVLPTGGPAEFPLSFDTARYGCWNSLANIADAFVEIRAENATGQHQHDHLVARRLGFAKL